MTLFPEEGALGWVAGVGVIVVVWAFEVEARLSCDEDEDGVGVGSAGCFEGLESFDC